MGSFDFQKPTALTISIQVQPNFRESMASGEIQAITFSGDLAKVNTGSVWHFEEKSPQLHTCNAIIHKAMLVSSGKRSSRASRPLHLLFGVADTYLLFLIFRFMTANV